MKLRRGLLRFFGHRRRLRGEASGAKGTGWTGDCSHRIVLWGVTAARRVGIVGKSPARIAKPSSRCFGMLSGMREMEYRERINRVIKAIIRNPDGEWSTESLAGLAGISAFHFHRIFRALTGETMFAFVQRRKLLRALELIDEGRFTLTEIALECGFDSGSSLSRAFRRHFNCTPTEYRIQHPALLLPPPRPRAGANASMQVEIRSAAARRALLVERRGIVEQSFSQAATDAFRVLMGEIKRTQAWPLIRERIGMCPDEAGMVPDEQARYRGGFLYAGRLPLMSEDVQHFTIPSGRWAVSLHRGSYETCWQSWNRMYRDWLPASGYCARDAAPFEMYLNHPKQTPPAELQTEIWIPIE
jgi:AraC family transcriptional regulator